MKEDTASQRHLSKPIGSDGPESFLKMVVRREKPRRQKRPRRTNSAGLSKTATQRPLLLAGESP